MKVDVKKDMIKILSNMTGFDPEEIKMEMSIVKDLGVDSLKIIEIVTALEKMYKVVVKESEIMKITTVGQSIDLVEKIIANKQKP